MFLVLQDVFYLILFNKLNKITQKNIELKYIMISNPNNTPIL